MYSKVYNIHQNYLAVKKADNLTTYRKKELLTNFLEELKDLHDSDISRNFSSDVIYLHDIIQRYLNTL